MPERRGGGDFDLDSNYHGPERQRDNPGPVIAEYNDVAKQTIGRWAGDRIALVGDYAEDTDLDPEHKASTIYGRCNEGEFTDVTDLVVQVVEHECGGKFQGSGWREFVRTRS